MSPKELTELAEYTRKLLMGAIDWGTEDANYNETINIIRCALEKVREETERACKPVGTFSWPAQSKPE